MPGDIAQPDKYNTQEIKKIILLIVSISHNRFLELIGVFSDEVSLSCIHHRQFHCSSITPKLLPGIDSRAASVRVSRIASPPPLPRSARLAEAR